MPLFGKKKKGESKEKGKKPERGSPEMPLFRRQSEKCRKRQQDQELLAQQDPEPRFDMSSCELREVPSGVYAICKVLQKQVLLLHDNWLSSLSSELAELSYLQVLDLHNNEFKTLPEEISCLTNLKVLNVAHNKLKSLPDSFSKLSALQTLNLKHNRLKEFPDPVCDLRFLRTLDISSNEVHSLPVQLCHNRALETLVLDTDKMHYPKPEVCSKTTAAVMMFLCGAAEVEYEHPSKYWLKVEAAEQGLKASTSEGYLNASQIEAQMMEGVHAYQNVLDQKRKDAEELEKVFHAEQEAQAELAALAADNHRRLLSSITQNQDQITKDLTDLNSKREAEREELLQYLTDVENGASSLLSQLLDYNVKAKETEELLEMMEEERMKEDDWFTVRWEELQNLRKQEVLDAMKVMLTEFADIEEARLGVEMDKDETRRDALEQETLDEGQMESLMYHKDVEHQKMVRKLAKEDALQKAAFEALMFSRDSAHSRIRSQIMLIESELAQLTTLEMDQQAARVEHQINIVADQRIALSAMLSQLLEEKEKRQAELKKRLGEMEQQREDGQADYWLVQYQRLLDWKPQALIDRESQLEIAVKEVLVSSGAEDYIPVFARHRITIETLMSLTEADLSQMGVHELGLRKAIMKNIAMQDIQVKTGEEKVREKLQEPCLAPLELHPSAPSSAAEADPAGKSVALPPSLLERQSSITARGVNSECAVCLDKMSNIIFLPCGHVCCCTACAQPLSECPLCRAEIKVKVKLSLPQAV
ncbi:E3 ubiquitin-protein ligase LRSAM1 [Aplysia californica]|uniref:E3 ubiquitin-protein ligase LRSAM1 n=1 Tax=Aplysia californica TaxID=6500 RepID=A0ABM1ABK9_APLCA|nr:E3 ubiquitin-protein ligase LRSAM1 [Aplysia californica]